MYFLCLDCILLCRPTCALHTISEFCRRFVNLILCKYSAPFIIRNLAVIENIRMHIANSICPFNKIYSSVPDSS